MRFCNVYVDDSFEEEGRLYEAFQSLIPWTRICVDRKLVIGHCVYFVTILIFS